MRTSYIILLTALSSLTACTKQEGPSVAERRAAFEQQQRDQLANERRTLQATDSLLQAIAMQINTATTKGFTYEKTEYDELGRFTPNGMDPGDNVQRTYLRSAIDDYGRTQLICTYCGPKSFCVEQLRFTSSDGSTIETRRVAPNDGSNYSYEIDGTHYQSVTFAYAGSVTEGMTQNAATLTNADTDNGALGFIAQHADDSKLKCQMIASDGKTKDIKLSDKDRLSLLASYELGVLLRESTRLQQENKTASLKIQYLEDKVKNQQAGK